MEKFNLTAGIRGVDENTKHLRADKKLPAVVYGKTQEAISLTLDYSEFLKMFRNAWESSIINLKVGKKDIEVLVHSFQQEPVSGDYIHIDFYALTRGEKLTTKISLNFIGDSAAIKEGCILSENVKELEVSVLPKDLIESFDVDLSLLKEAGDVIKLSDLGIDTTKFEVAHLHADDAIAVANKPKTEVISDEAPESNLPVEETKEEETK